ncbi:amidase [Halobacillus sp. BBL2006]|uniref:amidase n=1 Tax=Halobacillus sp. BBL2006 TaxID=1543706 RepID=UPI0005436F94|nr:amidase [Halobacillus sp. BBL2006]KHE72624.1 amidase [Halobacillus sp. BBL2006]
MEMKELHQFDGTDLLKMIEQKALKTEEVIAHYKAVIDRKNPVLNAVVHKTYDEKAEEGKFQGLPFLIKDLNAMKSHPLSFGSKIMEGFEAATDDVMVRRFKQAGLTIVGKSNTPEFGFTPATESVHLGFTKNPWNLEYSPGGSSGGAAAAVASGMVPFAHASDGGGSIRIPASNCGLFGLKPTRGRTPFSMRLNSFAVSHALTRSVRDSAALLDALEGPQVGDLFATPQREGAYASSLDKELRPLKIAYLADFGELMDIEDDVIRAVNKTAQLCESLGHHVEIDYPDFDLHRFMDAFVTVWVVGGALAVKEAARMNEKVPSKESLEKMLYTLIEKASGYSALEYEKARVYLATESLKVHQFFEKYDVLLTPVNSKSALPLGSYNGEEKTIDEILAVSAQYAHLSPVANVTGQPAMSVPLYWNDKNVPIGSHFMGRFGEERTLFKLAAQLEKAKPWWKRYEEIM